MLRTIPLFLLILAACGPMPSMPDAGSTITLGNPSPSSMPAPMGGSPNVLGPCTGTDGSPCSNSRGICTPSVNIPNQKQCLAAGTSANPCPRGSFAMRFSDGLQTCLDRCSSVRDCATGFFCNPTVLPDERGNSERVQVCLPGAVNQSGFSCTSQADCEFGSTELTCTGSSTSSAKICTRSCSTTADCGAAAGAFGVVCARSSMGGGVCVQACTPGAGSVCDEGLSCTANGHCLPGSSGGNSGGGSSFPTPAYGRLGGACTNSNECEGRYSCLTSRPGGLCTATCRSSAECGDGVCIDQQGTGVCFAKCSTPGGQSTCRSGYQCRGLQNQSYGYCL